MLCLFAALNYNGDINETIDSSVAVALRRAYYTSVTYVDSLIGKVNIIVILLVTLIFCSMITFVMIRMI